jgi:hypothetical protein
MLCEKTCQVLPQLFQRFAVVACIAMLPIACLSTKGGVKAGVPEQRVPTGDDVREKQSLGELEALYQKAADAQKRGAHEDAIRSLRAALEVKNLPAKLGALRGSMYYDIACSEARLGRLGDAFLSLEQAAKNGYTDADHAAADGDLAPLRDDQRFTRTLQAFRENGRKLRVYDVVRSDSPDLGWASVHKFENIESPYFSELRTKYRLDTVVAKGKTESEKQLALLSWVHNRWPHAGLSEPPHEDALTILREVEAGKRFRCVEYSVVSTQVLQAMGYPARVVGLRTDGASFGVGKGHVVTEVWNNDLQKWILVDGQNNGTWQVDGASLSAVEIRHARLSNPERLRFVLGSSTWMPVTSEPEQRAEWGQYFEHLSFRFENVQPIGSENTVEKVDLLHQNERYELLFQGTVDKNHVQTSAVEKVYPLLGRVHVDLSAVAPGKPETRLTLTHSMPWFSHYRVRQNGIESTTKDQEVLWRLKPGKNEMVVAAVNAMKVEGKPTTVVLDFIAPE